MRSRPQRSIVSKTCCELERSQRGVSTKTVLVRVDESATYVPAPKARHRPWLGEGGDRTVVDGARDRGCSRAADIVVFPAP